MSEKPRYSIKKYLLLCVLCGFLGFFAGIFFLGLFGFGAQGLLVVALLFYPLSLFVLLYSFYKGLVKHYGLKGDENLFFDGKL